MVSKKIEDKEKPAKELVPRKKLQSVPDLLANGPNEEESWITKTLWMGFLLTLFYLSFEIFLKLDKMNREQKDGSSEL